MLLYKNRSGTFSINKKYRVPHIPSQSLRQAFVLDLLNHVINSSIIKFLFGQAETSNMLRKVYGHTNERFEEYRQAN
ncbi:hypothetical protein A5821_002250 [Enterococcus sp. 7F3_DIV0205]|uniref:Uncharacterized protein n=1 Tax=Candidatus Enterococcus palustris TaxID=1834189 RepID=A0A242ANQ5_9ENTE|nr:hypothetical protein A5821_002600 [Enterococcus sp. 7F3_DIV0205]OTN82693.1 hypothetical protein A5821_002604 [Enterococcus sp. 7F3_DIV0205]